MSELPKMLIIAGPNGSGKTSVTENILQHVWIEGCETAHVAKGVMNGGHDVHKWAIPIFEQRI
jgi:predicted ABC-type ATPase